MAVPEPIAGPRKRGNPNWGKHIPVPEIRPTEFEMLVRQLRLLPGDYVYSAELHAWCQRNKNRLYIPEWLLEAWDITVDPGFSSVT